MTSEPIPKSVNGRSALQVARMAAREAGDLLLRRFGNVRDIRLKSPGNPVTDVDLAAEHLIEERLSSEYPDMAVLGEESPGLPYDDGYVWIVDPLDGTRNYACGVPHFSVVIGLALDGRALVGVNYDPVRDEMFEAELGGGAFLNRQADRRVQKIFHVGGHSGNGPQLRRWRRGQRAGRHTQHVARLPDCAGHGLGGPWDRVHRGGQARSVLPPPGWSRGTRWQASCWCARPEAWSRTVTEHPPAWTATA